MNANNNQQQASLPWKKGDRITYTYGGGIRGGIVRAVCAGHVLLAGPGETVPFRRILGVQA